MIDKFKSQDTRAMQVMIEEALLEIDSDANVSDRELLEMFSVALAGAPSLYFKVKRDNGLPIAFLIGRMATGLFTTELQATILLAYVAPDFRDNNYAVELYKDFETWAEGKGATKIFFNSVKGNDLINDSLMAENGIEVKGSLLHKDLLKG